MEVLDALVDLAPPPQPRNQFHAGQQAAGGEGDQAKDDAILGVVFKVQANMDRRTATASPSCACARASTRRA